MGRPKIKIYPEQSGLLRERYRACDKAKDKERLQAALLATGGSHSIEEIAKVVCRAKSAVQKWLDQWKSGGIEGLLRRGKPPGRPASLSAQQCEQLQQKLKEGKLPSIVQLQRWMSKEWGTTLSYNGVRYWVGKAGAVMRVPRPCHVQTRPAGRAGVSRKSGSHSQGGARGSGAQSQGVDER